MMPEGNRLIEPFVGSGTVFLNTEFHNYILCDANKDLVNFFNTVKFHHQRLIVLAKHLFDEFCSEKGYYEVRDWFNCEIKPKNIFRDNAESGVEMAAAFLYMNRHGFHGLCRYNKKGQFNVPYGHHKKSMICFPEQEIIAFSEKARKCNTIFLCQDYSDTLQMTTKKGDIFYCDPPYFPTSKTASFTEYSGKAFTNKDQKCMFDLAKKKSEERIPVLISNSDTENTRKLYRKDKMPYENWKTVRLNCNVGNSNNINRSEVLVLLGDANASKSPHLSLVWR